MRFSLKLNGRDVSHMINKWGVTYTPIRVEGQNSGVSQGGSSIVDLLRTKDSFSLQGNGIPEADYMWLLAECANTYVTAEYKRPRTGAVESVVMIPTLSQGTQVPLREGVLYYEGWTLSLEEK